MVTKFCAGHSEKTYSGVTEQIPVRANHSRFIIQPIKANSYWGQSKLIPIGASRSSFLFWPIRSFTVQLTKSDFFQSGQSEQISSTANHNRFLFGRFRADSCSSQSVQISSQETRSWFQLQPIKVDSYWGQPERIFGPIRSTSKRTNQSIFQWGPFGSTSNRTS
jgi:hypothetical protein